MAEALQSLPNFAGCHGNGWHSDIFSRVRLSPHTLPAMYASDILGRAELALKQLSPTEAFLCVLVDEQNLLYACVLLCVRMYVDKCCQCRWEPISHSRCRVSRRIFRPSVEF